MSQESEDLLSKRVVNYLRNEALVGRINSKKLKTLASILAVSGQIELSLLDGEAGGEREAGLRRQVGPSTQIDKLSNPSVMSDLLSAWVLTTGDTSQQTNTARLSGALDQARLSYHSQVEGRGERFVRRLSILSQEVRKMSLDDTPAPSASSRGSKKSKKKQPGRKTGASGSFADSGMVSGTNSSVTDNGERKYLDIERIDYSGASSPSERSRTSKDSEVSRRDILDFEQESEEEEEEEDTYDGDNKELVSEESSSRSGKVGSGSESKLPKIVDQEKAERKKSKHSFTGSPTRLPQIQPGKQPRYPNVQKPKVKKEEREAVADMFADELRKEQHKNKNSEKRKQTKSSLADSEDEDNFLADSDSDSDNESRRVQRKRDKTRTVPREVRTKSFSPVKSPKKREVSPVKTTERLNSKKKIEVDKVAPKLGSPSKPRPRFTKEKDRKVLSDDEYDGERVAKSLSPSKMKKSNFPQRSRIKKEEQDNAADENDEEEHRSVSQYKRREDKSPTKTRKTEVKKSSPMSPSKSRNVANERESPKKQKTKVKGSKSEFDLQNSEDNKTRGGRSPTKSPKKGKMTRSFSESVTGKSDRNASPAKGRRGKSTGRISDSDDDIKVDERNQEAEDQEKEVPKSPKKKKFKDLIFSDEEEESPFGNSRGGKGGRNYWRRTTYLDILTIEKERRESIKKMKEEKEKEREKNGGKPEKKEKFIRDSNGIKVFLGKKKDDKDAVPDHIDLTVKEIVDQSIIVSSSSNYGRNRDSLMSMITRKIKEDAFLRSMCQTDEWFLKNIINAMVVFGPMMKIYTKSQALTWIFLTRLAQFWNKDNKHPPGEKEIINDAETMAFAMELAKLCFNMITSDQVVVTAVVDLESEGDPHNASLSFEQYDVMLSQTRLERFDIANMNERAPYKNDVGNFMECSFHDKQMMEFMACLHIHTGQEELGDISKTKTIKMIPLLCALASRDKSDSQKIVFKVVKQFGDEEESDRNAEYYLKYLQGMFLESPITFLHCIHESRMKKIHLLPPPNERQIYIVQTKMAIHDIVALAYYLENFDRSRINPEALVIQDCGLNDDALQTLGKRLWSVKTVKVTGNTFTQRGIHEVTRKIFADGDFGRVDNLDLSDCQLDDECLIRLVPVFGHVSELYLSDNNFTWYGIRKLSSIHRRSKKLAKLDMSRCQLSQNGFYELIPIVLKTEHVILQGNQITPIELKIFSSQMRESKGSIILKKLDISNSNLTDESLQQIAKLCFLLEEIDLHNSNFGEEGAEMLVKCYHKFEGGDLKTINLRMCKLTDKCLEILSEIIPHLQSVVLSSNNFGGSAGLKALAESIDTAKPRKLKHIDLRHSRVGQEMKKIVNESCRKHKIDLKIW